MGRNIHLSDKAVVTHVMVVVRDGDAGGTIAMPLDEFAKLFVAEEKYERAHCTSDFYKVTPIVVGQRQGAGK